ncbi:MAG: hypothetical protein JSS66_12195 [Armatimonadetes bacterium]|nr:hypothetical protein [Armatimonadota bacterium]
MAKTWRQKYNNGREPVVETIDRPFAGMAAGAKMLILTPAEIDQRLRQIPRGTTVPLPRFRDELAHVHGADGTCPLTTSIFLRIVAEVALEEIQAGKDPADVSPFWRVLDAKSPVAKKLSCGPDGLERLRRSEA